MDNNFVDKYINLVRKIAHSFNNSGILFEDLVQEGLLGLCEAHNNFDDSRGTTFSTFATHCIKNKLLSYVLREKKQNLDIPSEMKLKSENNLYCEPKQSNFKKLTFPHEMPEIEKKFLSLYFEEKKTLKDISEILCVSREKTRQIKQKAIRRYKLYASSLAVTTNN